MNFYAQGAQAALMKLGAVPFTGQEAQYFQELLQARGLGAPMPKTQMEVPGARPITELPPSAKTIAGGVERGTMATGAGASRRPPRVGTAPPPIPLELEHVPGGGRQLAKRPAIPMELPSTTGRQLGVPLHRAGSLEHFLPPMEAPGANLARQMGKVEGAKALGLGAGTQVMEEGLLKRLLRMGQKVRI